MAFDIRVVPSVTTSQLTTRPTPSNSFCNSASVVLTGNRCTCSKVVIVGLFQSVDNAKSGDSSPWGVCPTRRPQSMLGGYRGKWQHPDRCRSTARNIATLLCCVGDVI